MPSQMNSSRHVCLSISYHSHERENQVKLTIETSSNMMLNSLARFKRSSLILAETISRFVMSSEATLLATSSLWMRKKKLTIELSYGSFENFITDRR